MREDLGAMRPDAPIDGAADAERAEDPQLDLLQRLRSASLRALTRRSPSVGIR